MNIDVRFKVQHLFNIDFRQIEACRWKKGQTIPKELLCSRAGLIYLTNEQNNKQQFQ